MNKIKFVKNPRISQIIIKSQKGQSLDERGIYVITNNQLKGLIKVSIEQKNTSFKLVYTTTGFVPLKDHLKNMMNKDSFAKLLQNILNILQSVQDANFYQECILFDINYVLVNPSTQNIYFIYVPIQNFEGWGTLRDFLLSIVQNASFAPGEDPTYIREYVSILNKKADFSIFDLRDYINSIAPHKIPGGASPNSKARCPRCNSPLADNIKFCASCGANVIGLTGDFKPQSQAFSAPVNAEPPRSNPRRGDSQPIDLLGIPTRPPKLKKPEPPKSDFPQNAQSFPPRSNAQPNKPQYPPQNNFAVNGQQYQQQNNAPQNNFAANGQQYPQRNNAPQNNFAANGQQYPQQNNAPQNNFAANGQQYPQQNNAPQNNFAVNGQQYPQQNNVPQNNFNVPNNNSNVVNITKSFREEHMNIPEEDPYFGGTVVLTDHSAAPTAAYLIRTSTGEKTAIDKPQFTVGRMLGHVDYCVTNNSAVGRQHIKITNNNGRYFICDLNSTNGTYIDEHQIPKNVDMEVFSGSKVTLANEDFKFIIE